MEGIQSAGKNRFSQPQKFSAKDDQSKKSQIVLAFLFCRSETFLSLNFLTSFKTESRLGLSNKAL